MKITIATAAALLLGSIASAQSGPVQIALGVGNCEIEHHKITGACQRTLDDSIRRLNNKPDARLRIVLSPKTKATPIVEYLRDKIDLSRVEESFEDTKGVGLFLVWQEDNLESQLH